MKKSVVKLLLCLSVLLNILIVTAVILAATGKLTPLLAPLITTTMGPKYERLMSQFEAFAVQSGDVVFLGDSITQGGAWHEFFQTDPFATAALVVIRRKASLTDYIRSPMANRPRYSC